MGRLICVGCGEFPIEAPWENFDITAVPPTRNHGAKLAIGDALQLDYTGAEAIYAGHMVEHLTIEHARAFFARVKHQAPTAQLVITVPAMDSLSCLEFADLQQAVFGGNRWHGDGHRSAWRRKDLIDELKRIGYKSVEEWPDCPWAVANVPWQIIARARG